MKPRRSAKTAVIWRRWPASSCSPSALEIERRDLGRHEPGQLGPLALDRLEQPGVLDRDGDLLGERRDEGDLAIRERSNLGPAQVEDTRDLAFT